MARAIAAAAMLAAVLFTSPAAAGTYCIPDLAFCYALPPGTIHGEAGFYYVSFDDDAPGGLALGKTGFDMINNVSNDRRGRLCVNGSCGGQYGYTFITDANWCGDESCYLVYTNGQCRLIARHHGYLPTDCHGPHGP